MNSNETTTSPNSIRVPYKFIRRNLYFDTYKKATLQKIRLKKLHLKNLNTTNLSPQEALFLFTRNKKIFKTLQSILISSIPQASVYTCLKLSKTIICHLDLMVQFLKKLPPRVQALYLGIRVSDFSFEEDLTAVAKTIRCFPQLKSVSRFHSFSIKPKGNHVLKELRAFSKSGSRLKGLKQVSFRVDETEQVSFQKAMRRNDVYHGITDLGIDPEVREFRTYDQMLRHFPESLEKIDDDTFSLDFDKMTDAEKSVYLIVQDEIRKIHEDSTANFDFRNDERFRMVDLDFVANCIMCEEMKPFFVLISFQISRSFAFSEKLPFILLVPLSSMDLQL